MQPPSDRVCRAPGCSERVELPKAFCPLHWNYLTREGQRRLADAFDRFDWSIELDRARKEIATRDPLAPTQSR